MNLLTVFLNVGKVNIVAADNNANPQYCLFNRCKLMTFRK